MSRFILASVLFGVVAVVLATSAVETLTVGTTASPLTITREVIQADSDVSVLLLGNSFSGSNKTGNGGVCPGLEAKGSNPVVRNAWTAGNLQYKVLIEEVSADAWPAGRIYRADVFGDGQLISRLYFKNANAGSTVEGVKMKVDLGSPTLLYGSFTTVITRLNACP